MEKTILKTNTKNELYELTIAELKDVSDKYLEEAYDFIKYLKMKSLREKDWRAAFNEALKTMNEISKEKGITEKEIEKEIEKARKGL